MGFLMAAKFLERPREKGQFKGKGYQKQVKSTSTTVVEDTTGSEEEHDDSSDEEHETGSEKVSKSGDSQLIFCEANFLTTY
ncbi:hypothetical protein C0J52_05663 [Blattella germanica]|nr:hypothetical protein C0J52_05663 [Blattella germanica]